MSSLPTIYFADKICLPPNYFIMNVAIKNRIRIFKRPGRSVSQNAVEAGSTEVRREGRVSTSRPPKSHVVDHHPFAEPPGGHTPTALCEISPRSYCTTNAVIANDPPHHPELGSIYSTYPVIANLIEFLTTPSS